MRGTLGFRESNNVRLYSRLFRYVGITAQLSGAKQALDDSGHRGCHLDIVFLLLLNALLAGVVAYAAKQKGRSGVGFYFLSLFFSFVVGILVLLAVPARSSVNDHNLRECPKCLAEIPKAASKCRHCQSDVTPVDEEDLENQLLMFCSKCVETYSFEEVAGNKCPKCRRSLEIISAHDSQ